jgi:drug/metabolite transporter (DMT)-like permease
MNAIAVAFGQMPANLRGIALMLLSAFMYAVMIVVVRLVSADIHPAEIVFFRLFGGLVVMLPAFWSGGLKSMKTTHYGRYTYRAALQGGAMVCYYAGLAILPLAQGVSLYQLTSIFISVLAIAFLGEPSRWTRWLAVLLGISGALVVIQPCAQAPWVSIGSCVEGLNYGALFIVAACALYATYQVDAKVLSRTEPVNLIVFWTMVLSAPMALAAAVFFWTWPSPMELFWLFVIGATGTLGNWAMTQAYKIGEMTVTAPVAYSQIVWTAALAWAVFDQYPTQWTWIGAAMIVAAGILLSRMEGGAKRS